MLKEAIVKVSHLGCDPEFVCGLQGKFFPAMFLRTGTDKFWGTDGNPEVAELRTKPTTGVVELIAHVKAVLVAGFQSLPKELKGKIEFFAGHYKFSRPIGAHIHLESPVLTRFYNDPSGRRDVIMSDMAGGITAAYKWWVAAVEPLTEFEQRCKNGYGTSSPWKWQTADRIEYRVPGSWLLSPEVAFATVWYVKTVFEMLITNMKILIEAEETDHMGMMATKGVFEIDKENINAKDKIIKLISTLKSKGFYDDDMDLAEMVIERLFKKSKLPWDKTFQPAWE